MDRVLTDAEVYAAMPTSDECEHFTVGDWVEAARRIEALVIERMKPQHMHVFRGDHSGCEGCGASWNDVRLTLGKHEGAEDGRKHER